MTVALAVNWRAREGEEERVAAALETMTPLTQAEPGCIHYYAHRSADDPREFLLYEQYVDREAFETHLASEYFNRTVRAETLPLLESRSVTHYQLIAPIA